MLRVLLHLYLLKFCEGEDGHLYRFIALPYTILLSTLMVRKNENIKTECGKMFNISTGIKLIYFSKDVSFYTII